MARTDCIGTLDTNIILRYLLVEKPLYEQAKHLITRRGTKRVSLLTLAEVVYILEGKKFTRQEISQNLLSLAALDTLDLPRAVVQPALEIYISRPAISFVDACLAFEADVTDASPLWTFDKKLANQVPHTRLVA